MEKNRLNKALSDARVRKYIDDYYKERGKASYVTTAISRWKKGTHYPPVEILHGVADILDTNISYVLDLTDVDFPMEIKVPEREKTLEEILETSEVSERDFYVAINYNNKALESFKKKLPFNRITSLMTISNITGLSIDYILGYTNWKNWELCGKTIHPFKEFDAGEAAFVVADKNVRSKKEVKEALDKKDGMYCLVSADRKMIIFPNGNTVGVNDEIFEGAFVAKVKPEI